MRAFRRLAVFLALPLAASLQAQTPPAPPQLTWVRFFNADPMKAEQFRMHVMGNTAKVFDQLVSERKAAGWGILTPFVMSGQAYTHAVYITMSNWSGADELDRAFEQLMAKMTPAQREAEMSAFVTLIDKPPVDAVLRHLSISTAPPVATFTPRYAVIEYYTMKPGRGGDALALFREWAVPILSDLQTNGVVGNWGFSSQEVGSDPTWTHMVWYFTDRLAGIDRLTEASMALPAMQRRGFEVRLNDMSDMSKRRVEILSVVHASRPPAR